jgi:hypothetical protein
MCGQFLPLACKFQILIFHIQMRHAFAGVHALLGLPLVIPRARPSLNSLLKANDYVQLGVPGTT